MRLCFLLGLEVGTPHCKFRWVEKVRGRFQSYPTSVYRERSLTGPSLSRNVFVYDVEKLSVLGKDTLNDQIFCDRLIPENKYSVQSADLLFCPVNQRGSGVKRNGKCKKSSPFTPKFSYRRPRLPVSCLPNLLIQKGKRS